MTDESFAVLIVVTSFAIGWIMLWHACRRWKKADHPLPQEVRDTSHAVANEATIVRASLQQIAKAQDPITELIHAMAGKRHDRDH